MSRIITRLVVCAGITGVTLVLPVYAANAQYCVWCSQDPVYTQGENGPEIDHYVHWMDSGSSDEGVDCEAVFPPGNCHHQEYEGECLDEHPGCLPEVEPEALAAAAEMGDMTYLREMLTLTPQAYGVVNRVDRRALLVKYCDGQSLRAVIPLGKEAAEDLRSFLRARGSD